jgi:plastocyanin
MHMPRRLALAGLSVLAVAACTSGDQPAWTYAPPPSATPVVVPSESPATSAEPGASAAPSAPASAAPAGSVIELSAQNVQFDKASILAPAGQAFQIRFTNNDAGVLHNVEIKDANGATVFKGEIFAGVDSRTYQVDPLPAGEYQFICTVHPNMVGTLSVG